MNEFYFLLLVLLSVAIVAAAFVSVLYFGIRGRTSRVVTTSIRYPRRNLY